MGGKAQIMKHPVHPMTIVFPLSFWFTSVMCDGLYAMGVWDKFFKEMAFVLIMGGVLAAGVAAIPGFIDYLYIRPSVKPKATAHMILNLLVLFIFFTDVVLRARSPDHHNKTAYVLSILGAVYVHGVGVEKDAIIDKAK